MTQRERSKLIKERDRLAIAIRKHPIQVSYGRTTEMTLGEYCAAIKRRDEIERLLSIPNRRGLS